MSPISMILIYKFTNFFGLQYKSNYPSADLLHSFTVANADSDLWRYAIGFTYHWFITQCSKVRSILYKVIMTSIYD